MHVFGTVVAITSISRKSRDLWSLFTNSEAYIGRDNAKDWSVRASSRPVQDIEQAEHDKLSTEALANLLTPT